VRAKSAANHALNVTAYYVEAEASFRALDEESEDESAANNPDDSTIAKGLKILSLPMKLRIIF